MIEINNTSFSQLEKLIVMKSQKYDIVTKDYNHLFENLILNKNYYLKSLTQRLTFPKKNLINQESNLFFLIKQMKTNIEVVIEKQKNKLFSYDRLLQSNSYEKILKRGFTIIFDDTKKIIKKKSDVKKNQKIKVLFSDGEHNGILK